MIVVCLYELDTLPFREAKVKIDNIVLSVYVTDKIELYSLVYSDKSSYYVLNCFTNSIKSPKLKKSEPTSRSSPNGSTSSSSANHHSHPVKRKNMAEMIVDRVFRKTGSSFKVGLQKIYQL